MTRALISGIAGFVGSHLAEYLIRNTPWEVVGLMRWNDPTDNLETLIPWVNRHDRIRLVYADLRDPISINAVVRDANPAYVFHLAAQSYPQTSFTAPADTLETNIQGTLHLLEAIREYAPKACVHVCSSSEVYGRVTPDKLPIKEDCPFYPASPYSISKVGTDLLGKFYADAYKLKVVVTRMFTHTGPRRGDVFAESSFAKQIAMIEAGQLDPVVKVGNLESLRTIADVRDAVRAYHMALTVNPIAGEIYNIGGNYSCKVGEILATLFDIAGQKYEVAVEAGRLRPLDADLQIPDCSKFINHTGWKPQIPFRQTMTDLLCHWRDKVKRGAPLQR